MVKNWRDEGGLRYVNSKLSNILFTYELHRYFNEKGIKTTVNAFHPGFIPDTGLSRDAGKSSLFILKNIMPLIRPFVKGMKTMNQSGSNLARLVDEVTVSCVEVSIRSFNNRWIVERALTWLAVFDSPCPLPTATFIIGQ